MIQQITVFIENKPGRLTGILQVLAENGIDLNGITVADSSDFGVFRMILSDPQQGEIVLKQKGYIVKTTEVLAIDVHDTPGGLLRAMQLLSDEGVNVQYMYAFGTKLAAHAMIILKTDENKRAAAILEQGKVDVLSQQELEERLTV